MRTRSGLRYGVDSGTTSGSASPSCSSHGRKRDGGDGLWCSGRKRRRVMVRSAAAGDDHYGYGCSHEEVDFFDGLPDDLVLSILCKLSSTASCPADLISVLITCKRLNGLLLDPVVLARASQRALTIRASNWSESAHRFLRSCAEAGNLEACYILGMIRFYCLHNRPGGASMMAKAAVGFHPAALYSLAVIQFNGSGGTKNDKDLRAGVALCARAAFLGHVDALRELGHCLQDGYGVPQNVNEGRRLLVQANARELASVLAASRASRPPPPQQQTATSATTWRPQQQRNSLLSDYGRNVPLPRPHTANQFLVEWFTSFALSPSCLTKGCSDETLVTAEEADGLRLCSHAGCGRPETRRHEFRRCSVCGAVNYCSRACQALDWKLRHKAECIPMDRWLQAAADAVEGVYAAPAAAVAAQGYQAVGVQDGPALAAHVHP